VVGFFEVLADTFAFYVLSIKSLEEIEFLTALSTGLI